MPNVTTVSAKGALDQSLIAKWAATLVLTPTGLTMSSTSVSTSKVLDSVKVLAPVFVPALVTLDKNTSHQSMSAIVSMPQSVTTHYDSLTSDKLPSSKILFPVSKPSLHSAAALKSVQILSKFWGDELEEVLEDTLSHDERLAVEDHDGDFEQHYPSLSESNKAERKKKKQVNKVKPSSFNSAGMRTRAQKGSPKATLTDIE